MQCEWSRRPATGLGGQAIEAPRVLAHEAADDAASGPLDPIAGDCGGARRAARSGAGAGRRSARQPLRRPGGDGVDPRRRQRRLLLGAGARPAHSPHRRPLSAAASRIWRSIIATPRGRRSSFRSTRRSLTRATAPTPFRPASNRSTSR